MKRLAVGVDLGGTNIKSGVVTSEGEVLSFQSIPTEAEKGKQRILDNIELGVRNACESADVELTELACVGIGSPGPLDLNRGMILATPNLPLKNVHLKAIYERRLGVPVVIENDANAAGYGEAWIGAGRGANCMLMFTLGTGIGGAIVLNGELWHGTDGTGGELGHIVIEYDGELCGCGNRGCLEAYAAAPATVKRLTAALDRGERSAIRALLSSGQPATTELIYTVAKQGDQLCRRIIEETGMYLGVAFASYVNIFNPDIIVLHGGMTGAGKMLLDPIRAEIEQRAFEAPAKRVKLIRSVLKGKAGVIGAAGCAFRALETSA